jgi:hypothetical protein
LVWSGVSQAGYIDMVPSGFFSDNENEKIWMRFAGYLEINLSAILS